jgi:hypothetical protein
MGYSTGYLTDDVFQNTLGGASDIAGSVMDEFEVSPSKTADIYPIGAPAEPIKTSEMNHQTEGSSKN